MMTAAQLALFRTSSHRPDILERSAARLSAREAAVPCATNVVVHSPAVPADTRLHKCTATTRILAALIRIPGAREADMNGTAIGSRRHAWLFLLRAERCCAADVRSAVMVDLPIHPLGKSHE